LLYEEAAPRQWRSATDIPWETVKPLPDDVERAMCQLCTFLTEVEFIAGDAPGQWLAKIHPPPDETERLPPRQPGRQGLHGDVRHHARLRGGVHPEPVPHRRVRLLQRGGEADLPAVLPGRVASPGLRRDAPEVHPGDGTVAAGRDPPLPGPGGGPALHGHH